MQLVKFMTGMFTRRPRLNGELDPVRDAGADDGERVATAYVDGFVAGATAVLENAQNRFLGYDGDDPDETAAIEHQEAEYVYSDVEDAEYQPAALTRTEIRRMRKPQLISELRDRDEPTSGTAKELTERLIEVATERG